MQKRPNDWLYMVSEENENLHPGNKSTVKLRPFNFIRFHDNVYDIIFGYMLRLLYSCVCVVMVLLLLRYVLLNLLHFLSSSITPLFLTDLLVSYSVLISYTFYILFCLLKIQPHRQNMKLISKKK